MTSRTASPPTATIAGPMRRVHGWHLLPFLLLLCGLALTCLAYQKLRAVQEERAQIYFDFRVREAVALIEQRMASYQQVLRGVVGLFAINDHVTRQQFRTYNEQLKISEYYPGIQGIGYAVRLPAAQLPGHVAAVRHEGFPDYTVRSANGPYEFFSAIIYLEPFTGRNLRAFGFDMYSEPVRRAAMQQAMDSGHIAMSGKVRLLQENEKQEQAGFLVYAPIYARSQPLTTVEERRTHLQGWAYQPFRVDDLLQGLFGEHASDLHIELYDGSDIHPDRLMHASQHLGAHTHMAIARYVSTRTLDLMGHRWTLRIASTPSMQERVGNNALPLSVAIGGLLLSGMLTALVWTLATSRARALKLARSMNEDLHDERARLQAILDGTHVGTWEWNVQTGHTVFNDNWAQMLGYQLDELAPVSIDTWARLTHPDDMARVQALLQECFSRQREYYEAEMRMRHKDGHWIWVLDRGKVASWTPDGKPLMMFGTHQDISAHKQQEEHAWDRAHHDVLTKLPNRELLADRLQQSLRRAHRERTHLALLFIDLDDFKHINDTYGHAGGDQVLQAVALRLQANVRESDTVARIGGDEFVVMLPDVGDADQAQAQAHKLRLAVLQPIAHSGQQIIISISIGVAVFPQHAQEADMLMALADEAMYQAKHAGKNQVRLAEPPAQATDSQNG